MFWNSNILLLISYDTERIQMNRFFWNDMSRNPSYENTKNTLKMYFLFKKVQSINQLKIINLCVLYEGWNFNSGNYLFTADTK